SAPTPTLSPLSLHDALPIYDAVIFMLGWGSISALLGIAACRLTQTPFFLYGDSSFPPPEDSLRALVRATFIRAVFALAGGFMTRSEEHTSELQSQSNLVCRL